MLKVTDKAGDTPVLDTVLNTRVRPHIRIINGSLDDGTGSSCVLNGRIDPSTLRFLKVDNEYQRPLGDRGDIFSAMKEGKVVPNIEIGVRGQDFDVENNDVIIYSPAFIIDGWQRVGTALKILEASPETVIRIFGSVHFGTDQLWERHRFTELNKNVKKVSPNLHLRNMRDTSPSVLTLFGLTNNTKDFPLYKKVSWSQSMQRGELISALVLAKSLMHLHHHHTALSTSSAASVAVSLDRAADQIQLSNFRKNATTFVHLINECWPFGAIEFKQSAAQVKGGFLSGVATMLSRHPTFWDNGDRLLTINADDRRKLARFPVSDPQVISLASSAGKARDLLYQLLIDHMNSGRRTQRLRSRFES